MKDKWDLLLEYLQLVGALPEDVLELVADKFAQNTVDYRELMDKATQQARRPAKVKRTVSHS